MWSVGAPSGDPAAPPDRLEGPGHLQGLLGCSQGGLGPACGFSLHRGCLCSHPLSLVQNAFSVFHAFWHLFKALSMGWGGGGSFIPSGWRRGTCAPSRSGPDPRRVGAPAQVSGASSQSCNLWSRPHGCTQTEGSPLRVTRSQAQTVPQHGRRDMEQERDYTGFAAFSFFKAA